MISTKAMGTEECHSLRDTIEEFVRTGRLQRYVQGREVNPSNYSCRSVTPTRKRKVVPWGNEVHGNPWEGYYARQRKVREEQARTRTPPQQWESSAPQVIFTIAVGFAGGGSLNAARKKNLREILSVSKSVKKGKISGLCITFSKNNYGASVPNHDDPLVLSGIIANCEVKRIFADQGSSTDIIFGDLFEKLGFKREELIPHQRDLVAFTGERIVPRGM